MRHWAVIGVVMIAILGGVLLMAKSGTSAPAGTRELHLVVRDMTFFMAGEDTPNPTLRFRAGEQVRLVLRNEDTGMQHDFTVGSWRVASPPLDARQETVLEFRVPERRGTDTYSCRPHAQMMYGTIEVE
ncbi:MAG: hypothetical protein H0V80_03670 [Acidobacteria bacterium]|nr:hypothetical protein [Acidobacteriota bacterium]